MSLIEKAVAELKAGRPIIVTDAPSRENEGDFVMAAEFASTEWIAWGIRHSSGFLCAPMTEELANRFELPIMVESNQDTRKTAYTVSVDAAEGITTGISAHDRALTLRTLGNREAGRLTSFAPATYCRFEPFPVGCWNDQVTPRQQLICLSWPDLTLLALSVS